jgi:membrane-bound inhibitor of C-type lysozyme
MNTKTRTRIIALLAVIVVVAVAAVAMRMHTPKLPPTPENPQNTAYYSCNAGKKITAEFYESKVKPVQVPGQPPIPDGNVVLKFDDGKEMVLARTLSADGARYANADGSFVFWAKGNGILVLQNDEIKDYVGCLRVEAEPADSILSAIYANGSAGFSLRFPKGYTVDESYKYQALDIGKDMIGVKFTIPASLKEGTNLSSDTYLSVEQIPLVKNECSAAMFLSPGTSVKTVTDGDTTYSMATASDAAAGNRYEETVYAIPGTNPCMAVRYFVHYGVFENYPKGTIKEFDMKALTDQFDQIRRTILVNQ